MVIIARYSQTDTASEYRHSLTELVRLKVDVMMTSTVPAIERGACARPAPFLL